MKKNTETLKEYCLRVHKTLEDTREHNLEDLQNSRKSEDTDDLVDKYFHEPIALFFSRRFIKLGFSPNVVTILSMVFGVCGGVLFYPKNIILNLIGIVFQIFAAVLDCSDGQVARMTGKTTRLGRVLDGTVDGINFAAVYIALAFRMMNEAIPFTNGILWGGWIWLIVIFCGAFSHSSQARMADYYRIVHLFFKNGNELQRSSEIYEEYQEARSSTELWNRVWLQGYWLYTKMQEKSSPKLQALLSAIDVNNGIIPYGADSAYIKKSHKIIQMTNLLTFSLRAYLLYFLLITGFHAFYFPFVIIVMGLMKHVMIRRYEGIADTILKQYFESDQEEHYER